MLPLTEKGERSSRRAIIQAVHYHVGGGKKLIHGLLEGCNDRDSFGEAVHFPDPPGCHLGLGISQGMPGCIELAVAVGGLEPVRITEQQPANPQSEQLFDDQSPEPAAADDGHCCLAKSLLFPGIQGSEVATEQLEGIVCKHCLYQWLRFLWYPGSTVGPYPDIMAPILQIL